MVRFIIIGAVLAVAFTLYSLVDAAMTDAARARGVSKPVWVVLTILLPVIGGLLWFFIGKGGQPQPKPEAPDDDPRFSRISQREYDRRIDDLERQLRELDDEVFPGEETPPADGIGDGAAGAGEPGRGGAGSTPRPGPDDAPGSTDDQPGSGA